MYIYYNITNLLEVFVMYVFDLLRKVIRMGNVSVLIYFVLNIGIVLFSSALLFADAGGPIIGLFFYFISLAIALSPLGEAILRMSLRAEKIVRPDHKARLDPLFQEVYRKALEKDPSLSKDIQLFLTADDEDNAFATGRKTICLTRGMLRHDDRTIQGVLAHEFGHLSNRDTDLVLLITVGNFFVTLFFIFYRIIIWFVGIVASFASRSLGGLVLSFFIDIVFVLMVSLWTKIGVLLVMKSSRANEYEADFFAYELGYANELIYFLDQLGHPTYERGLFRALSKSHPTNDSRIAKLMEAEKYAY